MLTARMIEAFRAIILTGSMSEAAVALHISQPAISRLIKDMEAKIGFNLFDRRHGRVYPNEDALILFDEVHHFFTGLERVQKAAESIRDHEAGMLRIACMPAVGLSLMPRVIALFEARCPGIDVSLQVVRSPSVIQFFSALQSDVGFVEEAFSSAAVEERAIFHLKCVCILPPGHHLAERPVIFPEHLAGEPFINLENTSMTRFKIDTVFTQAGIKRKTRLEAPLSAALCGLVREGCGVSIVDPLTADSYASQGVISRPFEPTIAFSFKALSAPRVSRAGLLEAFLDAFTAALPQKHIIEKQAVRKRSHSASPSVADL